ncbi:MAG TPA: TatD family hydrolase [Candidatus Paceibacterota bacterium]|nr:TatD family hydrolase [Candidatus Paceibacterota bacterium]HRZ34173.1 TatD family hydrolase [Candidatus Paceibacterota bacterium]
MRPEHIDIHGHLNSSDFPNDLEEVIRRANENNIIVLNVGTNYGQSKEVVDLAQKYENLYAVVGSHPIDSVDEKFDETKYAELLSRPKVVGVGECGLDFFRLEGEVEKIKERQESVFRKQVELAIRFDKPLMIHCRDAYEDVLRILGEYKKTAGQTLRGNIHFFAGTKADAQKFLDLGFTMSFTGVITFAPQYEELVKFVPTDKIHAETDCPYVAPAPHRGEKNEPSFVVEVVKKMAEIKGLSVETLSAQLVENAQKMFRLPF